jgi:hypothetical protein
MQGRRSIAAVLLALQLASCTYWTATKTPLPELTGGETPPALLRVVTNDGETFDLTDPRVHNDTLIGGAVPDTGWVFVALADIAKAEVRKKQPVRTAVYVALAAGFVFLVAELCKDSDDCTAEDVE